MIVWMNAVSNVGVGVVSYRWIPAFNDNREWLIVSQILLIELLVKRMGEEREWLGEY